MLVDFIHSIKMHLNTVQISKIIYIYSKNLHDARFPPHVQTMCAKLLLNLVENIVQQSSKQEVRFLLMRIVDSFAHRLKALGEILVCLKKSMEAGPSIQKKQSMNYFLDLGLVQPIHTSLKISDAELWKDLQVQFKTTLLALKTSVYNLKQCGITGSDYSETHISTTFLDEMEMFDGIFRNGVICLVQSISPGEASDPANSNEGVSSDGTSISSPLFQIGSTISRPDKEMLEVFGSIFTFLEPHIFQEVMSRNNVEFLFQSAMLNPHMKLLSQYFLANPTVSGGLASLMLTFLVERLSELGGSCHSTSAMVFQHFKLVFMAVMLFPEVNEPVLRPHLANIIMSSLKLATQTEDPINFFLLLRALFRNIGGGRFESLYQEVFPLLHVLLETLNALMEAAHTKAIRELFVELCLTVPVRLSVLLPHLSFLMKPIVIALQAGTELVSQSLRTLELCVDNLNHVFYI